MVNWIDDLAEWDGSLPAALAATDLAPEQRDAQLRGLVARVCDLQPTAVVIERVKGRPPLLVQPAGFGLYLSTSSRGSIAAMAIARSQVGIDVELADTRAEIPWNVLHAQEATGLRSLGGEERSRAFARLWSLKEAYVKALGIGLAREPSSFAVSLADKDSAVLHDPAASMRVAAAETRWLRAGLILAAVSIVVLGRLSRRPESPRPAA
jgi:4'-phosphopantetheinyl transferase